MQSVKISTNISLEVFRMMKHYIQQKDIKESKFFENAILNYLQLTNFLPDNIIIPSKIVVSKSSEEQILNHINNPQKITEAMKDLFQVNRNVNGNSASTT